MKEFELMKQQFIDPPVEFSPMPFWFWNDELSKDEIVRQIYDFHSKEVDGFVIHPRMGLPREMPYLSEPYMELVEVAVAEAAALGMKVILYDEGMYPSGSACGMVVKQNQNYASRGLLLQEYPCGNEGGSICVPVTILPGESLVSIQAVRMTSREEIAAERVLILEGGGESVTFTPPDGSGEWSVLVFIETYTKGNIRGIHHGQDDDETNAPLAADLLNPDAVQAFISLTHEAYYQKLSPYFGSTVIAMFTDEPDLLGRGHREGLKPWTRGCLEEYLAAGGQESDLPALWFSIGENTLHIRHKYEAMIRNRLSRTYYKSLADWCDAHGIGLTGHPAGSNDIGLLKDFHIPGQDVVWRYIAPEEDKSLIGDHSTMGKCSSDSARHRGKRRNLNECFGVCGAVGGWSLSADNMKWYLDWLFVRGVNLISPHAFYYSIREERRDERPPDAGPNNIWWSDYKLFSRYIKRMSWLMTDSMNCTEVAILAGAAYLPWRIAKPMYEGQIEFNYLEEDLLRSSCDYNNGVLEIYGYMYKALLIEDGRQVAPSTWKTLETFVKQGGIVIELNDGRNETSDIGQLKVDDEEGIPKVLADRQCRSFVIEPASKSIRISKVTKEGILFYVIVNEGEANYQGILRLKHSGAVEYWYPWTGESEPATVAQADGELIIVVNMERRECLVVAVDPSRDSEITNVCMRGNSVRLQELSAGWCVLDGPWTGELPVLSSWTDWQEMEHFSGTVIYERRLEIGEMDIQDGVLLNLGDVQEIVRLWVNGKDMGVRMWSPYVFDLERELRPGINVLRVSVTNSLANRYDGKSLPSGMLGPVELTRKS
ncbi:hypothetical protein D7Z26_06710 [Cohnella endophytica]|uniref:Glycosyl hydrolases family 2 sugar binding domain-containing protein n=1 Tax=Cohnella endophytica TaxID=2419778 RepID=A0A494Y3Q7_9BACL|nr:glycosylhydrolase-like jelly roll fold domain-containing protein [Cohnella endophytica]RKP54926.1 hypothetical protein D7Z26_06710 [Cohnella endophytica]